MNKKLYVGNLPYSYGDEDLFNLFSEFGSVVDSTVIKDRATGRSKGFGFVEFSTEAEAQAAMASLEGKEIEGRKIKVTEAREKRQ